MIATDMISSETAVTMVQLNCGTFTFITGHDVEVLDLVGCPDFGECVGCGFTGSGEAQVTSVLRMHVTDVVALTS